MALIDNVFPSKDLSNTSKRQLQNLNSDLKKPIIPLLCRVLKGRTFYFWYKESGPETIQHMYSNATYE